MISFYEKYKYYSTWKSWKEILMKFWYFFTQGTKFRGKRGARKIIRLNHFPTQYSMRGVEVSSRRQFAIAQMENYLNECRL